jgi:hypothetical protein
MDVTQVGARGAVPEGCTSPHVSLSQSSSASQLHLFSCLSALSLFFSPYSVLSPVPRQDGERAARSFFGSTWICGHDGQPHCLSDTAHCLVALGDAGIGLGTCCLAVYHAGNGCVVAPYLQWAAFDLALPQLPTTAPNHHS